MLDGIIDLNKEIDRLVADFPGNRKLQAKLGVGDPSQPPYETLSDIPWHNDFSLQGVIKALGRSIVETMRLDGVSREQEDPEFADALDLLTTHTNRILIMELLGKSDQSVIEDLDPEIVKLYIKVALPAYEEQYHTMVQHLRDLAEHRVNRMSRLHKLLGEL